MLQLMYGVREDINSLTMLAIAKLYDTAKRLDVRSVAELAACALQDLWRFDVFMEDASEIIKIAYEMPEQDRTVRDAAILHFLSGDVDDMEIWKNNVEVVLATSSVFALEVVMQLKTRCS
jgi:hypothetical protein